MLQSLYFLALHPLLRIGENTVHFGGNQRLLVKTSSVFQLERSNQQRVTLIGVQRQEIRILRSYITPTSKRPYADANGDVRPHALTLLVEHSLLRDVRVDTTSHGPHKVSDKIKHHTRHYRSGDR